jgi:hypothetical protein
MSSKISQLAAAQSPLDPGQKFVLTQDGTPDVNLTFEQLTAEMFGYGQTNATNNFYVGAGAAQINSDGSASFNYGRINLHQNIYDGVSEIVVGDPFNNYDGTAGRISLLNDAATETIQLNGKDVNTNDGTASFLTQQAGFSINGSGNPQIYCFFNGGFAFIGDEDNSGTTGIGIVDADSNRISALLNDGSANFAYGLAGVDATGNFTNNGVTGFTGSGEFSRLTISGGIITAAS